MPRFAKAQAPPDGTGLREVALPAGTESSIPLAMTTSVNGVAGYETLYSFEDAAGRPMAAAYPATYEPGLGIAIGRR